MRLIHPSCHFNGAAVAIVKALSESKKETPQLSSSALLGLGISPTEAADL